MKESEKFIVYEARLPDGSVYIGRTGQSLEKRIGRHLSSAASGSNLPFHVAIRRDGAEAVRWSVLEAFDNWGHSMRGESWAILAAQKRGDRVLNLTRGGFCDKYDAGIKRPRKARKAARRGRAWDLPLRREANKQEP